ncbi:hypothetical protein, partial [Mesorhizobium sp.]|uniref:hypothetical protein n=1 Tax=Mesorhizobium sp. TaxID=1871066 RepID=UPI0025C562DA
SDDLLFRKAAALHVLILSMGQNELQTGLDYRGKVTSKQRAEPMTVSSVLFNSLLAMDAYNRGCNVG